MTVTHDSHWLKSQFKILYGKGVIEKDSDVAKATGYKKGNVSNYLNPDSGVNPSRFFIAEFLKIYGKHLTDESADLKQENKALKQRIKELEGVLKDRESQLKDKERIIALYERKGK